MGYRLVKVPNSGQLWPILLYIIRYHDYVGVYYDFQKPLDSNNFLFDFINEALELIKNIII